MTAKTFEIRDRMTFIPVLAVRLEPGGDRDRYLLSRAGYGRGILEQMQHVMLVQINGGSGRASGDTFEWGDRTYHVAHEYIRENFSELASGQVIDVEFILGETPAPKPSEQEEFGGVA